MNKGTLIVISGPAGSGKGTVVAKLLELFPQRYFISISNTTRTPRQGEIDGVHYKFHTQESFELAIERGEMLEWASFVDNYYGTPTSAVDEKLNAGINVILEIDVQGALQVKAKRADTVTIFIAPPNYSTLESRLRGRGTETEEKIKARLRRAKDEIALMTSSYDYLVINYDNGAQNAALEIDTIIKVEEQKAGKQIEFVKNFFKN